MVNTVIALHIAVLAFHRRGHVRARRYTQEVRRYR